MFNDIPTVTALPASDLDRAKSWYADNLDLKPVEEREDIGVQYETADGTRFFLYPSEFAGTNKATAISFEAGDRFDEIVEFLRSRGGVQFLEFEFDMEGMKFEDGIMSGPDDMRGVWFEDSEGNIIAVSTMSR